MKRSNITDAEVVKACAQGFPRSLDRLVANTGAPPKIALAAMDRACARGLIDWGVSLATAWPEPSGFELIAQEGGSH